MKTKKIIIGLFTILSFAVMLFSAFSIGRIYLEMHENEEEFKELRQITEYGELKRLNPDMMGRLYIKKTSIDYPVMRSPEDNPEYYLYRNFKEEYTSSGSIFTDTACSEDSYNLIIYGHHMWDGSMFGDLEKYIDKGKRTIYLDEFDDESAKTFQHKKFKVIAAFKTSTNIKNRIFNYADITNKKTYKEFIKLLKDNSTLGEPIKCKYGDEFLTLCTCSYHLWYNGRLDHSGRYVVIAKLVSSKELVNKEDAS